MYDAVASIFPIQNGEVKTVKAPEADSIQLVNETKAEEQPAEEKAASTTSDGQQMAEESSLIVSDGREDDKKEDGREDDKKEEPEVSTKTAASAKGSPTPTEDA